jgi:protein-arginine kinase activator protein McsA
LRYRKLKEAHDQSVESNKHLQENLKKTVKKLNDELDQTNLMNGQLFEEINIIRDWLVIRNIRLDIDDEQKKPNSSSPK